METPEGLREKYTFSGSCLFRRMKDLGLYSIDTESIHKKVEDLGLAGIFHSVVSRLWRIVRPAAKKRSLFPILIVSLVITGIGVP